MILNVKDPLILEYLKYAFGMDMVRKLPTDPEVYKVVMEADASSGGYLIVDVYKYLYVKDEIIDYVETFRIDYENYGGFDVVTPILVHREEV